MQDNCGTEATIYLPLDVTEGALQCHSVSTEATAWIYFTNGNFGIPFFIPELLLPLCTQGPVFAWELVKLICQTTS